MASVGRVLTSSLSDLKKEFLRLLDTDEEFRYAVAGYLGYSEILNELKALREEQRRIWESIEKLWNEVRALREEQNKLWEEIKNLRENQEKLWQEVRALREDTKTLWEEVRTLREGQETLSEGQEKLWEEVRTLKDGQERLWRYMKAGFAELRATLGATFEDYARAFLEVMLEEMGYPGARVTRGYLLRDREVVEVDMLCENPLVVGEATSRIQSIEDAEREVEKLTERVRLAEEKYGRKPVLAVLAVGSAPPEVLDRLKSLAEKNGFKLVVGRLYEES
ncbi:hypothetical protein [Infirmifilum sp. NZ]|uniref:hypothetical protein n=1 Tax=Infirmifilum sp. NZ TaxID=2926850 RepID=UPI00279AB4C4|nr:hypothetical protein [Infirmifilum sp. NZ]UNQ73663.1 hypothetical protein MOV14_01275 [Infirmifilum sp. NZ]